MYPFTGLFFYVVLFKETKTHMCHFLPEVRKKKLDCSGGCAFHVFSPLFDFNETTFQKKIKVLSCTSDIHTLKRTTSNEQRMSIPVVKKRPLTIGMVGFGHLGQYLYKAITFGAHAGKANVAWIWNRTAEKITETVFEVETTDDTPERNKVVTKVNVPRALVQVDMRKLKAERPPVDIILELCHPDILAEYIDIWLANCRAVYVGSPTGFAARPVLDKTLAAARATGGHVFVPTGALWGAQDIAKMGARGTIASLHITMKKPADSTRLNQPLQAKVDEFLAAGKDKDAPRSVVVFDGPVGELCPLAPNNVNTMACAALASGPNVGFAKCRGTLVIERESNVHVIEIEIVSTPPPGFTEPLVVKSSRVNPCAVGAVTGMATYVSFFSSLLGVIETLEREMPGAASTTNSGLRFC